jgi:outer membrane protein
MKTAWLHVVCALFAAIAMQAAAQPLKIGYVNPFLIENESPMAKRLIEEIRKEFEPRERQLAQLKQQGSTLGAELQEEGAKLGGPERQAKDKRFTELVQQFEQQRRSFSEDLEQRKNEAHAQLVQVASAAIKRIAEREQFDLILQQAVYGSPQIDITERVLAEMEKAAGSSGAR